MQNNRGPKETVHEKQERKALQQLRCTCSNQQYQKHEEHLEQVDESIKIELQNEDKVENGFQNYFTHSIMQLLDQINREQTSELLFKIIADKIETKHKDYDDGSNKRNQLGKPSDRKTKQNDEWKGYVNLNPKLDLIRIKMYKYYLRGLNGQADTMPNNERGQIYGISTGTLNVYRNTFNKILELKKALKINKIN